MKKTCHRRNQRGFTLLEILVATAIMGLTVVGVISGLAAASRNAARITEYDRAAMLAQIKMDELLADDRAPRNQQLAGMFAPQQSGGVNAGWQATIASFESRNTAPSPGERIIDRVTLEIWWMDGVTRRTYALEGFRKAVLGPGGVQ
jgi:prepilin-type N-terminal cleavage/methylation domain-containing protein